MECAKLMASFFVVFIHIKFPGELGVLADCLGRYAVPMFFAVSGYFNYQADGDKILRRTKHILTLYLIAVAVHILWGCFVTEYNGGSTAAYLIRTIPDPDELARWIMVQNDPFSGHLWYLNAAVVTYLVYWLYIRFWGEKQVEYSPLYYAGFVLFAVLFAFEIITPVGKGEEAVFSGRNAWFTGIPMFVLGIFIRQYQEPLLRNYRLTTGKLAAVTVAGVLLVIHQWDAMGVLGMPFGTLLILIGLMLLLVSRPTVAGGSKFAEKLILKCGAWSTWVYILHLIVADFYELFCQPWTAAALAEKEPWLRPVIVLILSLLAAMLADGISCFLRRIRRAF